MEFKSRSPFVSADSDDETHAAARVEASSALLVSRLFRLENGRRSRFAFCCTSLMPTVVNEQEKLSDLFPQLFNKVAGVYGLIAVFTGAGGSAAQLSLYIYSTIALVALAWGLNAVKRVSLGCDW